MKTKIVIIIEGGLIQNVLSTEEIDVGIIDYDTEGIEEELLTKIPYTFTDYNDKTVEGEDEGFCHLYPPEVNIEETERLYEIIEESYGEEPEY